jgi:ubiquinone/menaquinone biosynthesis C-methylase UbiE
MGSLWVASADVEIDRSGRTAWTDAEIAALYDRARPGYPAEAVEFALRPLRDRPDLRALDVGAGTGKLTRQLCAAGVTTIAVEPAPGMLKVLKHTVSRAQVLAGSAEELPLPDAAVDLVAVGQAFHWFDEMPALREIHRVLKPGGGVALIWNVRDERNELQRALSEIIDPLEGSTPRRTQRNWKTLLADSGLFEHTERRLFEHVQETDEQGVVDRVTSISFISAAAPPLREDVESRVRALVHDMQTPIRLTYMTEVYFGFALR